jgi:hypothetical protein
VQGSLVWSLCADALREIVEAVAPQRSRPGEGGQHRRNHGKERQWQEKRGYQDARRDEQSTDQQENLVRRQGQRYAHLVDEEQRAQQQRGKRAVQVNQKADHNATAGSVPGTRSADRRTRAEQRPNDSVPGP